MEKIVIAGNGPAGCAAAIYAARAGLPPLVLAGEAPGGLLTQTGEVENFPGFPDGVTGFDLVTNMQTQAEKFGARIEYETIAQADFHSGAPHKLTLSDGSVIETQVLIIASGAVPRYLGVPGEERLRGCGVSACATCDGAFFKNVPVVVAGGGDSAMEEATFLTRFASEVHLIHRRDQLRASKIMADRALNNPKIIFHLNTRIIEITGENKVSGVKLENTVTGEISTLECSAVFAALGHTPCSDVFKNAGIAVDAQGYIVVKDNTTHTNIPGVFAAGDCADPRYRQAVVAAGSGVKAALDAEKFLAGK